MKEELTKDDNLIRDIVTLSVGAVSQYEEISSYINDFDQTVVIIEAKLNRDSMQLVNLFPIDPDKASMNVNGSFYATESAKWRFNQKNEIEAIKHLLEKIQIIDQKQTARQLQKIRKLRKDRDKKNVNDCLARLKAVSKTRDNIMPAILDCAKAYCTLGEISDAMRSVFGEHGRQN